MYRATTPTHVFWFNEVDPNLTYKSMLITYAQNDKILLEKTKQDLLFGYENINGCESYYASVKLTQEETNLFSANPNNSITIQIRAVNNEDIACASTKIKIPCLDVLNDKELESEEPYDPDHDTYKGEYIVKPEFNAIILDTQGKLMISNVTVLPIQVLTTTNLSGGKTVYIGGIFNGE